MHVIHFTAIRSLNDTTLSYNKDTTTNATSKNITKRNITWSFATGNTTRMRITGRIAGILLGRLLFVTAHISLTGELQGEPSN